MKSKLFLLSVVALMVGTTACKQKGSTESIEPMNMEVTADNSQNSLDWEGSYTGVIPCADCSGISVRIDLASDNTYKMEQVYQGKDENAFRSEGKFTWNNDGNTITLEQTSPEQQTNAENYPEQIKVSENSLTLLDKDGNEITGDLAQNYILAKVNKDLVEKYWKLTELMGQPVTYIEGQGKEAFITFRMEGNRVHGNFGCNTFNGSYELKPGDRISFSQMASTMMMCPNMETEQKFSEVLQQADNYNLNGDSLVLNRARMAPLARFEAVYM